MPPMPPVLLNVRPSMRHDQRRIPRFPAVGIRNMSTVCLTPLPRPPSSHHGIPQEHYMCTFICDHGLMSSPQSLTEPPNTYPLQARANENASSANGTAEFTAGPGRGARKASRTHAGRSARKPASKSPAGQHAPNPEEDSIEALVAEMIYETEHPGPTLRPSHASAPVHRLVHLEAVCAALTHAGVL